ncbi:DUF859 family phage minor structural protein [uncultured Catenibacterium sp.]|uniref:DUF859 family phage minor structural protein n=1 Tax=uncultured Catenibacterium sp. TaxID=286142 RepID=UPI0025E06089|nr:DUF859 family phage minor structural protein [uncultured Catenibacterium sp.]
MATSSTCSASFASGNGNVTMTMTRTGVNVDENYDLWTANLTMWYKWNINSSATKYGSMWANGVLIWSGGVNVGTSGGTKTLATVTNIKIPHDNNGGKHFDFSFSQELKVTLSGKYVGSVSASGGIDCDVIPRATKPYCSPASVYFGNSVTIKTPRASSDFGHVITYSFYDKTEQIADNQWNDEFKWTVPTSLISKMPNASQFYICFRVDTYSRSGKFIGSNYCTLDVVLPSGYGPTVTGITYTNEDTAIANRFGASTIIQGVSKVKCNVSATAKNGATITYYQNEIDGQSIPGPNSFFTTQPLKSSGTVVLKSTVTDSRGQKATLSKNIAVTQWWSPAVKNVTAQRWNVTSNKADDEGTAVKITYSFSIAPVANKNDKAVMIQYKNGETWTTLATYTDSYSGENKVYISSAGKFNMDNAYSFRVLVKDYFTTEGVAAYAAIVPSFKLLDFSADGRGIGVGCKAESGKLKVDMPLEAQSFNGYVFDFDTENQTDTWIPVLTNKKIQHKNIGWSEWYSCGTNACGIKLQYRYNSACKQVELNWDGVVNATIGGNTAGYMWTGFPADKKPKGNMFIPVPNPAADAGLVIRFYPVTNDATKGNFTLTSLRNTINNAYICGFYTYSYA